MTDETWPRWPAELEGLCYEEATGWFWPVRQENGKIHRETLSPEAREAAGLPERPELHPGQRLLTLQAEPVRNLIPRATP